MWASEKEALEMVTEFKLGQMVLDMKANERITKLMEEASFGMLMEIYTMASERMIKQTAKAHTSKLMELCMKANERMIFKMDLVKNLGLMVANMKDIIKLVKSMALAHTHERKDQNIWVNGLITK